MRDATVDQSLSSQWEFNAAALESNAIVRDLPAVFAAFTVLEVW